MIRNIIPVTALLSSFAILCMGHGLQSVLLPTRGALFENPNLITGMMMSGYYVGFILGTFICPRLITRVGHIRIFAAAGASACAIMLAHALMPVPLMWILLRVVYGFCFIHLYTVMESWLNSIGDASSRGKILSIYMIINFIAMSAGQMLFFTVPGTGFELYSLSAMLLTLALVPLTLGRAIQPTVVTAPEPFRVRKLFEVSPLGVTGAVVVGLMGGAYWGMTAIYVLHLGYNEDAIAWFMAASLIGGLLAQWPLGSLSDRINRRLVILLAAVLIGLSSLLLFIMALWPEPAITFGVLWLVIIGALFGAGFHPLYSLCIAHANDFVSNQHFVAASAGLQMVQGCGAVLGPLLAGGLMALLGPSALFIYIGGLAAAFALYTLKRLAAHRVASETTVSPFRFLTRTGAFAFFLDPRAKYR